MSDATTEAGLQPSLLDRLTDEAPARRSEPSARRSIPLARLRAAVLRDLTWLLNTTNLASTEDLDGHPEVARSVLNFGIPDLAGLTASSVDLADVAREVRRAIQEFEPRILRRSVRVEATHHPSRHGHNALVFDIEGELWAEPLPLRLRLQSEVDLETGSVSLAERRDRERG